MNSIAIFSILRHQKRLLLRSGGLVWMLSGESGKFYSATFKGIEVTLSKKNSFYISQSNVLT